MSAAAGKTIRSTHPADGAYSSGSGQELPLKELMPSEVMANNFVDDLKQREAEMLFNIQGTFSARPDSFAGGYSNYLNNALQLYGAPPLVAQSLAAKQGQRNLEYCNTATTDGNQQCGMAEGLYGNLSSEQVQGQWTHPYMAAPGGGAQAPGCEKGAQH